MGVLLAYFRLFLIVFFIPAFLCLYFIWSIFGGLKMHRALKIRRAYLILINALLGLKVHLIGTPPREPGLVVANHRNFVDPFVIIRHTDALPVAKAEIAKYPVIGRAARITGIIYVDRKSKDSRYQTKLAIKHWISKGHRVLIYPEGTVNDEDETAAFKMGSFKIAAAESFKVFPVAVEFERRADRWPKQMGIAAMFKQLLSKPVTRLSLSFGPTLVSNDPIELKEKSKYWIDQELLKLRDNYDRKKNAKP